MLCKTTQARGGKGSLICHQRNNQCLLWVWIVAHCHIFFWFYSPSGFSVITKQKGILNFRLCQLIGIKAALKKSPTDNLNRGWRVGVEVSQAVNQDALMGKHKQFITLLMVPKLSEHVPDPRPISGDFLDCSIHILKKKKVGIRLNKYQKVHLGEE